MTEKLKLYSDKTWLPENKKHVILLYPFWGDVALPASDPDHGRFDDLIREAPSFMELTGRVEEADIVVFPYEYDFTDETRCAVEEKAAWAQVKQKRLLVFNNSDFDFPIPSANTMVLRTSFYKSSKSSQEFAFPGWSNDFLKLYAAGKLQPIQKPAMPAVSYCGYVGNLQAGSGIKGWLKGLLQPVKKDVKSGAWVRARACQVLQANSQIQKNFLIRQGFWAEGMTDKNQARREYAENMLASPYALVARGAGNFSYRLYEVLSCGKIPVFINTDCVLPYDTQIDWKKHMLWVEVNDIDTLDQQLLQFHKSLSDKDWEALQRANRRLYEEWLSPVGFFSKLHTLIKQGE